MNQPKVSTPSTSPVSHAACVSPRRLPKSPLRELRQLASLHRLRALEIEKKKNINKLSCPKLLPFRNSTPIRQSPSSVMEFSSIDAPSSPSVHFCGRVITVDGTQVSRSPISGLSHEDVRMPPRNAVVQNNEIKLDETILPSRFNTRTVLRDFDDQRVGHGFIQDSSYSLHNSINGPLMSPIENSGSGLTHRLTATSPSSPKIIAERIIEILNNAYYPSLDEFQSSNIHEDLYVELRELFPKVCHHLSNDASEEDYKSQRLTIHLNGPIAVCGDLHGSFGDLDYMIKSIAPFDSCSLLSSTKLLFLGDYVDRGAHSVEVVAYLFALRVLYPDTVFLLRGNHEDPEVNGDISQYGDGSFLQKCIDRFGDCDTVQVVKVTGSSTSNVCASDPVLGNVNTDICCGSTKNAGPGSTKLAKLLGGPSIWAASNIVFTKLPIAAVINKNIFACHGGIPRLDYSKRTVSDDITTASSKLYDKRGHLLSAEEFSRFLLNDPIFPFFDSAMPVPEEEVESAELNQEADQYPMALRRRLVRELIWNDPVAAIDHIQQTDVTSGFDSQGFRCNIGRGDTESIILEFSQRAVDEFLNHFNFSLLLRAHQHMSHGYQITNNGRVVTLFTSSSYCGDASLAAKECAAVCIISQDNTLRLVNWRNSAIVARGGGKKPPLNPPQLSSVEGVYLPSYVNGGAQDSRPSICKKEALKILGCPIGIPAPFNYFSSNESDIFSFRDVKSSADSLISHGTGSDAASEASVAFPPAHLVQSLISSGSDLQHPEVIHDILSAKSATNTTHNIDGVLPTSDRELLSSFEHGLQRLTGSIVYQQLKASFAAEDPVGKHLNDCMFSSQEAEKRFTSPSRTVMRKLFASLRDAGESHSNAGSDNTTVHRTSEGESSLSQSPDCNTHLYTSQPKISHVKHSGESISQYRHDGATPKYTQSTIAQEGVQASVSSAQHQEEVTSPCVVPQVQAWPSERRFRIPIVSPVLNTNSTASNDTNSDNGKLKGEEYHINAARQFDQSNIEIPFYMSSYDSHEHTGVLTNHDIGGDDDRDLVVLMHEDGLGSFSSYEDDKCRSCIDQKPWTVCYGELAMSLGSSGDISNLRTFG